MDSLKIVETTLCERRLKLKTDSEEKLKNACKDFEAIFTGLMLKSMRKTVPESALFGRSNPQEIFESLLDQEIANTIAHSDHNFGIGDQIYQKLRGGMKKND